MRRLLTAALHTLLALAPLAQGAGPWGPVGRHGRARPAAA